MVLPDGHPWSNTGRTSWHTASLIAGVKDTPLWPYVLSLAAMGLFAAVTFWLGYAVTAGTLPVCPEAVCPLHSATDVTLQAGDAGPGTLVSSH
jgi:hypothetical protein